MNHKYSSLLFSHLALFRLFLIVRFLAAATDDDSDEYDQHNVDAPYDEKIGPYDFTR